MSTSMIDLRSDTVTKPTAAMRRAMAEAEVGDDVIGVDPTVARLQERIAEMLGKEAAVYMPSGSMTNQIAVRVHCKPGDEFICDAGCHIYNYEQAAYASLSGVAVRTVQGEFGVFQPADVEDLVRPDNEHCVRTRLLALENTHNRASGRIQPYDNLVALCDWARSQGLATHLDGARLFNAAVASGVSLSDWAQHFDTVSVCFSKGLGAPVGSALAGPAELIREARRHRKAFGGGMRQAGIIAAGALYGLEHHVERLAEDHEHAQILANAIRTADGLELRPEEVDTNIVIFRVDPALVTAVGFTAALKDRGVGCLSVGKDLVRLVTHLDVTREQIMRGAEIIVNTIDEIRAGTLDASGAGTQY